MRTLTFGIVGMTVIMALGLAGCGSAGQSAGVGGTVAGDAGASLNENYADALPAVTQLVVGSFKLEETDLAVTADQALELVPLWQAYRTLLTSQTAAQQEREALVTQIEETMTAEQIQEIANMKLTSTDMQAIFSELGGPGRAEGTPSAGGGPTGQPGAGGGFIVPFDGGGGGFPGGGGGFPGGDGFGGLAPGQTPNPEAIATLQAGRGEASGLNAGLINVLIRFLQQKSAGTPTVVPDAG
jgi:hypothetical protein